jgi:hypothetical protein
MVGQAEREEKERKYQQFREVEEIALQECHNPIVEEEEVVSREHSCHSSPPPRTASNPTRSHTWRCPMTRTAPE